MNLKSSRSVRFLVGIAYIAVVYFVMNQGCSSAQRKMEHPLRKILLYNLHIRRPEVIGAEPNAMPGEYEFESHPRPGKDYDCVPFRELYKKFNLTALRECLSASSKLQNIELAYRLRRETAPFLELEVDNDQIVIPTCIKSLLSTIPVPREIFFQSKDEGSLNCYNARMPIVEEEALGIKSFLYRTMVQVRPPRYELPVNDEETLMLLSTWSMIPFFNEEGYFLISKIVPTEICRKCMGEKNLFNETDPLPPHWP